MKNEILAVKRCGGAWVALVDRKTRFCSWVVAWNYDFNSDSWGQGHYFDNLGDAKQYYAENY